MEGLQKNIVMILVLATVVFLGYYFLVQKKQTDLVLSSSDLNQQMFVDVQKYIERRNVLNSIRLDTSIFSDERFRSLVGYPTDIKEQPVGRPNPFDEV